MRLGAALALTAAALTAQQRTVHISTPQATVVSARTVQLSATLREASGAVVPNATFSWNSNNTTFATVDQSGVVTARRPGIVNIGATAAGNVAANVQIQVVPLRIEVTPAQKIVKVGETLQYTARAVDGNEQAIEGLTFQWTTVGANGGQINAARMDGSGMLSTNAIAKATVRASINYQGSGSQFIGQFVGSARLEIKAADSYRISRLLASNEAPTSVRLRLSTTSMAVSESGHLAFLSNLDGYATGVLLYEGGRFDVLASTGMPKPLFGGLISDFSGIAVNGRGQVLTYATGPGIPGFNSNGLLLLSREGSRMVMVNGSDSISVNPGGITRYSLNDRGDIVFNGNYAGSQTLFRISGSSGAVELVWSAASALPGLPAPVGFEDWGIDGAGDVYFRARNGNTHAYYRAAPFGTPVRVIGTGDTLPAGQIRNLFEMALAQSGEIAVNADIASVPERSIVRIPKGATPAQWQTISIPCCGRVRAVGPAGVLIDSSQGISRWKDGALTTVMSTNRPVFNGEPAIGLQDAGMSAAGMVFAQIVTPSGVLFVRDGTVIADAATRVEGPGLYSLTGFVRGARQGPAHIVMDSNTRSVFEVDTFGLVPRLLFGDRVATSSADARAASIWKNSTGDLYASWGGDAVFRITGDGTAAQFRLPPCEAGICVNFNGPLGAVNDAVLWTGSAGNTGVQRVYLTRNNIHTLLTYWAGITGAAPGPSGGVVRNVQAMLDGSGRVLAWMSTDPVSASGLFLYEDGNWRRLAALNGALLDLPEISGVSLLDSTDDGFLVSINSRYDGTLLARWRNGDWEKLIARQDPSAVGGQINNVSRARANSAGDTAIYLSWNGNSGLNVRMMDGSMRALLALGDVMPDGAYAAEVLDLDFRDDGRLYFLIRDFDDRTLLYVAEPL